MSNEYRVFISSNSDKYEGYVDVFAEYEREAKEKVKQKLKNRQVHDFWKVSDKEVELLSVTF